MAYTREQRARAAASKQAYEAFKRTGVYKAPAPLGCKHCGATLEQGKCSFCAGS